MPEPVQNRMSRRTFARLLTAAAAATLWKPAGLWSPRMADGTGRRVLPPETDLQTLIYEDPSRLDAADLPLTPTADLGVAGLATHRVDIDQWRLSVGGAVSSPLLLTYAEILDLPPVERNVLLICPGTFACHARWKGVSVDRLLALAGVRTQTSAVEVSGPAGLEEKRERFPLTPPEDGGPFLAYTVNGISLPEAHGFPLRLVADGHVGSRWVKFVDRVDALAGPLPEERPAAAPGPAFLP